MTKAWHLIYIYHSELDLGFGTDCNEKAVLLSDMLYNTGQDVNPGLSHM